MSPERGERGFDQQKLADEASTKKPDSIKAPNEDAIREITEEIYKQALPPETQTQLETWFRSVIDGPDKKGVLKLLREKVKRELEKLEQDKSKIKSEHVEMVDKMELEERFLEAVRRLKPDQKIIISFVDLDSFKILNDTLGHSVGDKVIQSFTESLRSSMANSLQLAFRDPQDICARLGGDEFGFMMIVSSDAPDSSVVRRIVSDTRKNTTRPSTTGEEELEAQELSVGYTVVTFEEVHKISKNAAEIRSLFAQKYEEADQRSEMSKIIQYVKEHPEGEYKSSASVERIIGPNTRVDLPPEELARARAIHDFMRPISKLFPKAKRQDRIEYGLSMWELPNAKDPEEHQFTLGKISEVAMKLNP